MDDKGQFIFNDVEDPNRIQTKIYHFYTRTHGLHRLY